MKKYTIDNMIGIARENGGKCISGDYINGRIKLKWQCEKGHVWEAMPQHIIRGHWCPICEIMNLGSSRKLTLEEMQELAILKGGKCLSTCYKNSKTKLTWECNKNHVWEAVPDSIKQGHWCPHCSGKARYTIEQIKEIALSKNGECLSSQYFGGKVKLEWKCADGHIWMATPHDVLQGTWCPDCTKYYTEEKCRFILEKLLKVSVKKDRKVLNGYELDGYNADINIAYEFHGRQHYKHEKFFHRTKEQFNKRQQVDLHKETLCRDKNIRLMVIPYYKVDSDKLLLEYMCEELKKFGIEADASDFSFDGFYMHRSIIRELKSLAGNKDGESLAETYVDNKEKIEWKCSKGHVFKMNANNVRNGHWCPTCAGLVKLTIAEMKKIAKE